MVLLLDQEDDCQSNGRRNLKQRHFFLKKKALGGERPAADERRSCYFVDFV